MSQKVFTSQILVVPDSFGYDEIRFDIEKREKQSEYLFIYINDEKSIKIDHLRRLQDELASAPLSPTQTRVVIIHPLEKLLHVAQQSLLKLLEEPPERTLIILAGNSLSGLAPTLLSRCEVIRVSGEAVLSSSPDFWIQAERCKTAEDWTLLMSTAPDKKDEALIWIRTCLASHPPLTATTIPLAGALNEGYEALLSNVTPKLVWGRVVSQVSQKGL